MASRIQVQEAKTRPSTQPRRRPAAASRTVSQAGDRDEHEADRMADQALDRLHKRSSSPLSPQVEPSAHADILRRSTAPASSQSLGKGGEVSEELASDIAQKKGGGQALDETTRSTMEQAFGTRFDQVRVHTDYQAHRLSRSLSAKAFTAGQDIFFKRGAYNPSQREGQALLAHELAHVKQQQSTPGGSARIQRMEENQYQDALKEIAGDLAKLMLDEDLNILSGLVKKKWYKDITAEDLKNFLQSQSRDAEYFHNRDDVQEFIIDYVKDRKEKINKENAQKEEQKQKNSQRSQKNLIKRAQSKANINKTQQSRARLLPDVNEKDICVSQGFFNVEILKNMADFGLQTDGVGTCTAIGIANADSTAYAYSHFDGEVDFAAAIDAMIAAIKDADGSDLVDEEEDQQLVKREHTYNAWIAAMDHGGTLKDVEAELRKRKNITVHKLPQTADSQFRLDPHEEKIENKLQATQQMGASALRYRKALENAQPLPFKQEKYEKMDEYTKSASAALSAKFQNFIEFCAPDLDLAKGINELFPKSKNIETLIKAVKPANNKNLIAAEISVVIDEVIAFMKSDAFIGNVNYKNPQEALNWLENAQICLTMANGNNKNGVVYMSAVANALTQVNLARKQQ